MPATDARVKWRKLVALTIRHADVVDSAMFVQNHMGEKVK
jgi:hypothetical protein